MDEALALTKLISFYVSSFPVLSNPDITNYFELYHKSSKQKVAKHRPWNTYTMPLNQSSNLSTLVT